MLHLLAGLAYQRPRADCALVSEHYADDLEVDLQAAMLQDFNAELEDDSPREVCSLQPLILGKSCMGETCLLHAFEQIYQCWPVHTASMPHAGLYNACELSPGVLTRELWQVAAT